MSERSRAELDAQRDHWEKALAQQAEKFGPTSAPAQAAADAFAAAGVRRLLELGAGQGRDTLFFAERGFEVEALDYAACGVAEIERKAAEGGLAGRVHASVHDLREPLPFAAASFDACYSHMLFCMALTAAELEALAAEVRRVLRPGGLHVYTARNTHDPDYGHGRHLGDELFEVGGYVIHFFSAEMVARLAGPDEIVAIDEFREGPLPRRLYRVTLRCG